MKHGIPFLALIVALLMAPATARSQKIVINEIMYHPSSENVLEEYIELYNAESTNVNVGLWEVQAGVRYLIPQGTTIPAGGYLIVAADTTVFNNKYPGIPATVVGGWDGILSNSRNRIELENASGDRIDTVVYADEGDWAIRRQGLNDRGRRGWIWYKEHDGLGSSLELLHPGLPNEHGQSWAASTASQGTPGAANSVLDANVAPLIVDSTHVPLIPTSTDPVRISARIHDDLSDVAWVRLHWRIDSGSPPPFNTENMLDDGMNGDGAAGDGLYGVILPAQANNAVVEYYFEASDDQGNVRTWPAPVLQATDQGNGSLGNILNAMYQVDNDPSNTFDGASPVYKFIQTVNQQQELSTTLSSARNSDAQYNATFISLDGTGASCHHLVGVRNRGHGSRGAVPHNFRSNFRSDDPWKGVTAINLNSRNIEAQHLGAVIAQKAGADGANANAVKLRFNNSVTPVGGGSPRFGHYVANEALNGDWAENHYPNNGGGEVYKVVRDIRPPNFEYRGENPDFYRNTYFKSSNESEDDWTSLINMLRVAGENAVPYDPDAIRVHANVEQWFTHLAVMNIFANNESGVNTGNNDDYFIYTGDVDKRAMFIYHDLDSIMGISSGGTNMDIFRPTCCPISGDSEGIWRAMNLFMHHPELEPIYYNTLARLISTTFSAEQFDPVVDQVLGHYVPTGTRNNIKNWMNNRRNYIQGVIAGNISPSPNYALISGEPRSPTWLNSATLTVSGNDITHYQYSLNGGPLSLVLDVTTPIQLTDLPDGSTNQVLVRGRNTAGVWQTIDTPTLSRTWVVDMDTPTLRINEVLARNDGGVDHHGTTPDMIELYNEFLIPMDLSGFRVTNERNNPDKYVIPDGTILPGRSYLVLLANDPDGTPGMHTGFTLDQDGDEVYLYNSVANGGDLIDFVQFGNQLADHGIGRMAFTGNWHLTQPTLGTNNVIQPTGSINALKINEWLAAGEAPLSDDFVEIYNPDSLPVDLAGLIMTDKPIGNPRQHTFPDATFVAAGGFVSFLADNRRRGGHVNFRLPSEGGHITLFDYWLNTIDHVVYGPQTTGISLGRCPNGEDTMLAQTVATPGAPNLCPSAPVDPTLIPLVSYTHTWRYDASNTDQGTAWRNPSFNDGGWPTGQSLFGYENGDIPVVPIRTPLSRVNGRITTYYRARFDFNPGGATSPSAVQIRHVIDDGAIFYVNGTEVGRFNLTGGSVNHFTTASTIINATEEGPINVPLNLLQPTGNVLAVELHQNNNNSADALFGARVDAVVVTNSANEAGIMINEVMADNATFEDEPGITPDLVEFYNPSDTTVNLAGLGVSDSLTRPTRWVFPEPSFIPARGYLTIRFDDNQPMSSTNTGFGLSANGDAVYLFDTQANGGGLLDFIQFGLQIADFSIGRLPDGSLNWALNTPTFGGANIAASLGDASLVRVNEWMADPSSGDDWFELFNGASVPVSIGGYFLTDDLTAFQKSPIPPLSFIGSNTNNWKKIVADGNVDSGANHADFSLRASGEAIGFFSPAGVQIDAVAFGQQTTGLSEGRFPDGSSNIVPFPGTDSPGEANFLPLLDVVINEVLTHTDLPFEDAIELHNRSGSEVDISGWWLSDARGTPLKYQIPNGTTIPSGGYHVLYEYRFNDGDFAPIPFSLSSAKGDEVHLSSALAGVPDGFRTSVDFGPSANGVPFGTYATSVGVDFTALAARTFGNDQPGNINQFRNGQGEANAGPLVGPVVITEIMYNPLPLGTNDNMRDEFVELHNISLDPVLLYDPQFPTNTWRMRKGVDFDFPQNQVIPAGGYILLVGFDPQTDTAARAAFEAVYGPNLVLYGPYSGKLDNGGEALELRRPDRPQMVPGPDFGLVPYIVVDRVRYDDEAPWPLGADGDGLSLQRTDASLYGNDPVNWVTAVPSPQPGTIGLTDTDGDGLPDSWETANGTNPNVPDADEDPDGDGMTNKEEFDAGTDPNDPNSLLQVVLQEYDGGTVTLSFDAKSGKSYSVLYRQSLTSGSWSSLTNIPAPAVDTTIIIMDVQASPDDQRFYQLVTPSEP